jgi:hypothetical protein
MAMQKARKNKAQKTAIVNCLELAAIKRMRSEFDHMRVDMAYLLRDLREAEEEVIERIEAGAPVDGKAVVKTRRRQNISWLTVLRGEVGDEAVIRAKDKWPVVFYKELQIG